MARFGCRILLRGVTNFSPIILVSKRLYYHPVVRRYLKTGLLNIIVIGDRTIRITQERNILLEIWDATHKLNLILYNNLQTNLYLYINDRRDLMLVYLYNKIIHSSGHLRLVPYYESLMSSDIFRICIPMFELLKAITS